MPKPLHLQMDACIIEVWYVKIINIVKKLSRDADYNE
jgi:hypothetical protein